MEVVGCSTPDTADGIQRYLGESDDYTFGFVIRSPGGRWNRGRVCVPDTNSVQQANDFFWADMASQGVAVCDLKLSAILLGDVGMVDEAQYGDEPGFDPDALARYAADPRPRQHFTVLSVWLTDDKPDFVRTVDAVKAVDWLHAELLAREHRQVGEFYITGVAELWVNTLKVDPDEIYATPNGKPLPPPAPPEQPEGHHGWRLFGH